MEVLYTSDYARGPNVDADPTFPIIILDILKVETTPIAEIRVDADGNFEPDRAGEIVTIQGVITSPTINSLFSLSINVQDETAGINVYSSEDSIFTNVGDLVQITGEVSQFNGLTQLTVTDRNDIRRLGAGTIPDPMVVTVADWLADPEKYESMLVKIVGLDKIDGDWPDSGNNSNLTVWDGNLDFTLRIDKDLDLAGQPEPVYPITVTGVTAQYSTATPPNSGYQILPRYYTDIQQDVKVPPSPYFSLLSPPDGARVTIADSSDSWDITWEKAFDINGDDVIYLWTTVDGAIVSPPLSDTMYTLTAETVLGAMSGADSVTVEWTVKAKGAEQDIVSSVDTFSVTFVNLAVGVETTVPNQFFVDQNYPNPFNPTTTIRFGLPSESVVDLRIYDILGREVRTIVSNQSLKAGTYNYVFDASSIASGTYIYRLTTKNNVVTKKMLLLK
jgi:hypothetical protein